MATEAGFVSKEPQSNREDSRMDECSIVPTLKPAVSQSSVTRAFSDRDITSVMFLFCAGLAYLSASFTQPWHRRPWALLDLVRDRHDSGSGFYSALYHLSSHRQSAPFLVSAVIGQTRSRLRWSVLGISCRRGLLLPRGLRLGSDTR
jgi:hypothetical protein